MTSQSYVRNLKAIDESIQRHNSQLKLLREKKKHAQKLLYDYMTKNGLEEFEGYKLSKIAPKEKLPIKKKAEKKADAINLFNSIGVSDPQSLWDEYQKTQRYSHTED